MTDGICKVSGSSKDQDNIKYLSLYVSAVRAYMDKRPGTRGHFINLMVDSNIYKIIQNEVLPSQVPILCSSHYILYRS